MFVLCVLCKYICVCENYPSWLLCYIRPLMLVTIQRGGEDAFLSPWQLRREARTVLHLLRIASCLCRLPRKEAAAEEYELWGPTKACLRSSLLAHGYDARFECACTALFYCTILQLCV